LAAARIQTDSGRQSIPASLNKAEKQRIGLVVKEYAYEELQSPVKLVWDNYVVRR
jgi:hypothetical protein